MNLGHYAAEFDRCAAWLEKSLPYCHGTHTLQDLREATLAGRMQLWPGERSALLTEIIRYPRRTGCHVAFAGGDLEELRKMADTVEAWAKSVGCDHITVSGRAGWVRALGRGEIYSTMAGKDL